MAAVFGLSFGKTNAITRIVYVLVGLSAVYVLAQLRAISRRWTVRPSVATRTLVR